MALLTLLLILYSSLQDAETLRRAVAELDDEKVEVRDKAIDSSKTVWILMSFLFYALH